MLAIYSPFVEATAMSFESVCPTVDEFEARIRRVRGNWQWLIAEQDGRCAGYAHGGAYKEREAYRSSTQVAAYVRPDFQRRGIGRALYRQLFDDLAAKGYCQAFAGIPLPNEDSVALHRALEFTDIGIFRNVARKFGKWHDVQWLQKTLRGEPPGE